MGLSIAVGALARALRDGDAEGVKSLRRDFKRINRLLGENDLPEHTEPESLPDELGRPGVVFGRGRRHGQWLSDMPYAWLILLRRAVAHARHGTGKLRPAPDDYEPPDDPLYADEIEIYMDSHIVCHSDSEGYYVPVEFDAPLDDDKLPGYLLGSSQAAIREVVQTAPLLGIRLRRGRLSDQAAQELSQESEGSHPFWAERHAWLCLFENLRLSVEYRSAVVFG